jgi:hypothetical protein
VCADFHNHEEELKNALATSRRKIHGLEGKVWEIEARGLVKDRMATREGGGVNRSRQKFFPKNPAYVLLKPRSHTSGGSNHAPIAKTTRLWINL